MTLSRLRNEMTPEELLGWHAYFSLRAEEEEKAIEKAKRSRR